MHHQRDGDFQGCNELTRAAFAAKTHYGMSMVLVAEGPWGVSGPNSGKSVPTTYISSPVKTITLMGLK
jgi:hypothetical protein